MTDYSQTYGVKSNAKRAMRKIGVAISKLETTKGGWRFPMPATAAKTRAEAKVPAKDMTAPAPRRFPSYIAAQASANAAAKRAGLKPDDYVIVILPADGRWPAFGFVSKHRAGEFTIATSKTAREAQQAAKEAVPTKPAKTGKARGRAANGAGGAKEETVLKMMRQAKGAAMPDICKATDWLPHTARARISGIAKKHKKELDVTRVRIMGVSFYYAKAKAAA